MDDPTAKKICEDLDKGRQSPDLKYKENIVAISQRNRKEDGQRNRVIKHVWINVFGFSRGAAAARVFVHKLVNDWAPKSKIANSISYGVNFVGLFDTVASVGLPDSANGIISAPILDGHFEWTSSGRLNIPSTVKRCVHFFSIHEQRMSFPLDTVREGDGYPQGPGRLLEVAYPGVHSDVGGGYVAGEQGKSREGDYDKLSRIPLHDMYIEALKAGVPLDLQEGIKGSEDLTRDFGISSFVCKAFNAWLDKVIPIRTVEDAMEFGMRQNLLWRTLRARIGTGQYITNRTFYKAAREDKLTPIQVEQEHDKRKREDSELARLRYERGTMAGTGPSVTRGMFAIYGFNDNTTESEARQQKIAAKDAEIQRREEALYAEIAGKPVEKARPGEGAGDIVTNDRTDLLEGTEDFRLLLAWLYPHQHDVWQAGMKFMPRHAMRLDNDIGNPYQGSPDAIEEQCRHLSVARENRPAADTKDVFMVTPEITMVAAAVSPHFFVDDLVLEPAPEMVDYLRKWTASAAVDHFERYEKAAVKLFDDYIHDSRAWFRVPHFHEYAPGGYGWARTFFVGNDTRIRHLRVKIQGFIENLRDSKDQLRRSQRPPGVPR